MDSVLSWATVLSPVVGVAAIIVALIIAQRSSKETKNQIAAVYNLLDVFVASQNPAMMEAKRKYEQHISDLNKQIQELEEEIQTNNFPPPGGPLVNVYDVLFKKNEQCERLEVLENKRKELEGYLDLINAYIQKSKNQHGTK